MKQQTIFPDNTYIPYITLKGRWLEKAGFTAGKKIRVYADNGRLAISKDDQAMPENLVLDGIVEKEYQKLPSIYHPDYRGYTVSIKLERDTRYVPVRLSNPHEVYDFLSPVQHESREIVLSLMFNAKNYVVGVYEVGKGGSKGVTVSTCEVMKAAVLTNSAAIILAHNHPSGVTEPSPEDIQVTNRIIEAAKILDIIVHDHIIIGYNTYSSLRDLGYLSNANIR